MEIRPLEVMATAAPVVELDRLGDEIAELSAHLDAATARLLALIREFDVRGGWNSGFRSCADWLVWRVGLAPGPAREKVRVARALGTLPLLAQALARGEVSYSKVRALTRVATPETEERLLAVGRAGTAAHAERIVRGWRRLDRQAEAREAARQHASRALHVYPDSDGTVRIKGRLTPEVGALLTQALAAARETLYQRRRDQEPEPDPPTMEGAAAGGRAVPAGGNGAAPGPRSGRARRAVPGDRPRRCPGAGRRGSTGPVPPRGRHARSRGNVSAPGVRRQPSGDAARSRRAAAGSRRPHAHHSAGATKRPPPPRPRLSLPGLPRAVRPGPPHPPLGPERPYDAVEPRVVVPRPPPRRARGGVRGKSTTGRRALLPPPERAAAARGPASAGGARRSDRGPPSRARGAGTSTGRADRDAGLARRTSGRELRDRCLASVGSRRRGPNGARALVEQREPGRLTLVRAEPVARPALEGE